MSKNFLDSSTIHGFKYLQKEFHFIERIFWTISLLFSGICATFLIFELIMKIKTFPIVSYVSDQSIPVEQVDFPAVTLCSGLSSDMLNVSAHPPFGKLPFGKYAAHTLEIINFHYDYELTEQAEKDFDIVGNASYLELLQKLEHKAITAKDLNSRILKRLHVIDLVTRQGTFKRLKISISADNFLYHLNSFEKVCPYFIFTWGNRVVRLSEILTEHGFCCTFNLALAKKMLNIDAVSADFYHEYYENNVDKSRDREIPKAMSTEEHYQLHINTYQASYDRNFFGLWEGHKVYIHSPYEYPNHLTYQFFMPKTGGNYLYIEPQLFVTDESLYDMEPTDRNCYLEHEKFLKFFKIYTKNNCEHECMAEFVLQRCGCVEFFMIRNFTTRICSSIEKDCFDSARNEFNQYKWTCKCFQPCNYMKYNAELHPNSFLNDRDSSYDRLFSSVTGVRITGSQVNQFIRKKQFDKVDFLSFVGGLLGLFAGFSALSFVEINYWIVLKINGAVRQRIKSHRNANVIQVVECNRSEELEVTQDQNLVEEYFAESSIHGFNYMIDIRSFETLFWIVALIISLSLCFTLIAETNQKVPDSRVLSIDGNLKTIGSIPFPAITYSTFYFIDRQFYQYLGNIPKVLQNLERTKAILKRNPVERKKFMKNLLIYQLPLTSIGYPWDQLETDADDLILEILRETSNLNFYRQQFASFNGKHSIKFAEVHLKNILGINFNLMDSSKLLRLDEVGDLVKYNRTVLLKSVQNASELSETSYPIRMSTNDRLFEFVLKVELSPLRYNWSLHYYGTPMLIIHPVDTYPNFFHRESFITPSHYLTLTTEVTPVITRTDEDLKSLKPETRECYFEDERPLKFFKIYSEANCKGECLTNITFQTCGCALVNQIYSPKHGIRFCYKISEFKCAFNEVTKIYEAKKKNCLCLPSCNSINYNIKHTTQPNDDNLNMSTVIIRMNTENTILYRRYQQFTFSDVVSYIGGLLGLFAGISVLSIFEILYFFTLRLICEVLRVFRGRRRIRTYGK